MKTKLSLAIITLLCFTMFTTMAATADQPTVVDTDPTLSLDDTLSTTNPLGSDHSLSSMDTTQGDVDTQDCKWVYIDGGWEYICS